MRDRRPVKIERVDRERSSGAMRVVPADERGDRPRIVSREAFVSEARDPIDELSLGMLEPKQHRGPPQLRQA